MSIVQTTQSTQSSIVDTLSHKNDVFVGRRDTSSHFLESLRESFRITPTEEKIIYKDLLKCFSEGHEKSGISMVSTNCKIPEILHSTNDSYLCLDVGGSTIRIAILTIRNKTIKVRMQKEWLLERDEKLINFAFFDDLVNKGVAMINVFNEGRTRSFKSSWNIGITWSFPLNDQHEILNMGKGFSISPEVDGFSLLHLIQKSFNKVQGLEAGKISIINDSVAVSLSNLLNHDFESDISLIIGTGINSCILNNNEYINTELGFFGKLPEPNEYDIKISSKWLDAIDPHITQPRMDDLFQPLEFICSGRYICELFRLIVLDLIELDILSFDTIPGIFTKQYETHGSIITTLENITEIKETQHTLSSDFNINLSVSHIRLLHRIVDILLTRSSTFVSLSIKALHQFIRKKQTDDPINVVFVGSFLSHSKLYQKKIVAHSNGLICLNHVDNSSIVGAGVAAALKI